MIRISMQHFANDSVARALAIAALDGGGGSGEVTSVNGKKGAVVLNANDVHALPNTTVIPTKTSDLTNDSGFVTEKPYTSLRKIGNRTYEVTFANIPEYVPRNELVNAGCTAFVSNGMLHRYLDYKFDNMADFRVITNDFEGMAFINGLNDDGDMSDELIGQLPYNMVDGVNKYGIKVCANILFNDFDLQDQGEANIPLTYIPYYILSEVHSMDEINKVQTVLNNIKAPEGEYIAQWLVTDGNTTYVISPSSNGYEIVDATENPKLTNFKWVADTEVDRADLQDRPVGVERWNELGEIDYDGNDVEYLYTHSYDEDSPWLSEFIGINGTTKDSTDEELREIQEEAREEYLDRKRDGKTWHTVHLVQYQDYMMIHLYSQEDVDKDLIGVNGSYVKFENRDVNSAIYELQDTLDNLNSSEITHTSPTYGDISVSFALEGLNDAAVSAVEAIQQLGQEVAGKQDALEAVDGLYIEDGVIGQRLDYSTLDYNEDGRTYATAGGAYMPNNNRIARIRYDEEGEQPFPVDVGTDTFVINTSFDYEDGWDALKDRALNALDEKGRVDYYLGDGSRTVNCWCQYDEYANEIQWNFDEDPVMEQVRATPDSEDDTHIDVEWVMKENINIYRIDLRIRELNIETIHPECIPVDGETIYIDDGVLKAQGGTEVSGTNDGTNWTSITIDDDTYAIPSGGGSEPSAYIKSASVSNNTLTLTNKDDTTVEFTPSGGGSSYTAGDLINIDNNEISVDRVQAEESLNVAGSHQLISNDGQLVEGTFIARTTAGDASITSGSANHIYWRGNSQNPTYQAEIFNADAEVDRQVFISAVDGVSGTYEFIKENDIWKLNDVEVSLEDYGITDNGEESITVSYTAYNAGHIINATPTQFISTKFNQYDSTTGKAFVIEGNRYQIFGTYTSVGSETIEINYPINAFVIPYSFVASTTGWIDVVGGSTDTMISLVWSGYNYNHEYEEYEEDTISFTDITGWGMPRVNGVYDEIDFERQKYVKRIGRDVVANADLYNNKIIDDTYVYYVLPQAVEQSISMTYDYYADDFGQERFLGTDVPVSVVVLYGSNLKDKLRTDVVTLSAQTLTTAQQDQVKANLGISGGSYPIATNIDKGTCYHVDGSVNDYTGKNIFITARTDATYPSTQGRYNVFITPENYGTAYNNASYNIIMDNATAGSSTINVSTMHNFIAGSGNTARGNYNVVMNSQNNVHGEYATVFGRSNWGYGNNSFTIGKYGGAKRWSSTETYKKDEIVVYHTNIFVQSKVDNNKGNTPSYYSDTTYWKRITAAGMYDYENPYGYAFAIGNGTSDSDAHNAFTVDWSGNTTIQGNVVAANIPAPPSADGEYDLHCSIVDGAVTYSWTARS